MAFNLMYQDRPIIVSETDGSPQWLVNKDYLRQWWATRRMKIVIPKKHGRLSVRMVQAFMLKPRFVMAVDNCLRVNPLFSKLWNGRRVPDGSVFPLVVEP